MGKLEFTRLTMPQTWGGEATTLPLIVYFVPLHEAHIQMAFCLGTVEVGTPTTLGPHNLVCKSSIEMRFIAKL
jgi:hypothetical protein